MTPDEYLVQAARAAVECERETGCPAEVSVAQWALESAWGKRAPGNNCFGIKDTDRYPDSRYVVTKEYLNGEWRTMKLAFEVYPTLKDCFIDHACLITRLKSCYGPAWLQYLEDRDLDAYIDGISRYYATDPQYAVKIKKIAHNPRISAAIAKEREMA